MRNIVILNSLHFSYPLPILMRVSYNTLIVKQNTSDYYKYIKMKANHNDPCDVHILQTAVSDGKIIKYKQINNIVRPKTLRFALFPFFRTF